MAMGSQIFDIEEIAEDIEKRGFKIKECLFQARRTILKCWGCYLHKVCSDYKGKS